MLCRRQHDKLSIRVIWVFELSIIVICWLDTIVLAETLSDS